MIFHLVDQFGHEVPAHVTSFRLARSHDRHELSAQFKGLEAKVPFGFYEYEIKWSPCGPDSAAEIDRLEAYRAEVVRIIKVQRPQVCGAAVDGGVPLGFVLEGTLDPTPSTQDKFTWVSLDSVNRDHHLDVRVEASGKFRIEEPLDGLYVLSVRQDGAVLHTQTVTFHPKSATFVIHVPKSPPAPLEVGSQ